MPVCTLQVKVAEAEHEERARAARRRQAALNMEAQRAREQVQASAIVQAHTKPTLSCNVEQPICHPVPPEPDCIVLDPAAVQGMPGSGLVLFLVWHITERHQSCHTVLCVREQTWSSLLQAAWQPAGVFDPSQQGGLCSARGPPGCLVQLSPVWGPAPAPLYRDPCCQLEAPRAATEMA